jgi:FAD synthase
MSLDTPAKSDSLLPLTLTGVVKPYKGDGRRLGYPTANMPTDTSLTDGVYFGFADLGQFTKCPALIFIGTPSTMGEKVRRVEAHLLDIPDNDYYGQKMTLKLYYYHRANQKFASLEELQKAMKADEKTGRAWFSEQLMDQ